MFVMIVLQNGICFIKVIDVCVFMSSVYSVCCLAYVYDNGSVFCIILIFVVNIISFERFSGMNSFFSKFAYCVCRIPIFFNKWKKRVFANGIHNLIYCLILCYNFLCSSYIVRSYDT